QLLPCPLPQCVVSSVDHALAMIASKRNNRPDRRLLTIGVLGTSGKTSTSLMLATMMKSFGMRVAYQTDLGSSDGVMTDTCEQSLPCGEALINWLGESADCMCKAAIIEIDDHSARTGGYDAIQFDVLVVTGKDAPGEDFGPSSLQCLTDRLTTSGVIIAPEGNERIDRVIAQADCQSLGYGTTTGCEFGANIIDQSGGMSTIMLSAGDTSAMMETALCGYTMASNIAAASTLGVLLGFSVHQVGESLSSLRSIPGRCQRMVDFGRATVVLENGGRPDRIQASLRTARATTVGGQTWCVLSLGDFYDAHELARIGSMIERHSHRCIVTGDSDDEAFLRRAHLILDGVKDCAAIRLVADPRKAISWAIRHAGPRDTITVFTNEKAKSPKRDRETWDELKNIVETERQSVEYREPVPVHGTKVSLKLYR
ncbi:glutamate ligase domain-containing protein, partial [Rhodopirellula sp. MGV]|uniref:glutamate ligase domain-containing protein n=1 Tax=Rhodopirellula sp. MGV TaxID=2023130 RepID=UPI00130424EA